MSLFDINYITETFVPMVFSKSEIERYRLIFKNTVSGKETLSYLEKNPTMANGICDENISGYFEYLLEEKILSKNFMDFILIYDIVKDKLCGILAVNNNECNDKHYLKNFWVLQLICVQCSKMGSFSIGKVLMGIYMTSLKLINQPIGILELGKKYGESTDLLPLVSSSYNNTPAFCVYNKFGFVPIQSRTGRFITKRTTLCEEFDNGNIAMISLVNLEYDDYYKLSQGKSIETTKVYPRLPLCVFPKTPQSKSLFKRFQEKIVNNVNNENILKAYNAYYLKRVYNEDEPFSIFKDIEDVIRYINFYNNINVNNMSRVSIPLKTGAVIQYSRRKGYEIVLPEPSTTYKKRKRTTSSYVDVKPIKKKIYTAKKRGQRVVDSGRKSMKRKSPKRKSMKRKSPKKKSPKRKSPKRKPMKRKSPKRK